MTKNRAAVRKESSSVRQMTWVAEHGPSLAF
jgi:hypothetical protein